MIPYQTDSNHLVGLSYPVLPPLSLPGCLCRLSWTRSSPVPVYSNLQREGTNLQSPATLVIIFSRSRTGFRKTDTILSRLIRGAIQTGLFAGLFSMGDVITFVVLPNATPYGMFAIPLGRIYSNVSVINATKVCCPLTSSFLPDPLGHPPHS